MNDHWRLDQANRPRRPRQRVTLIRHSVTPELGALLLALAAVLALGLSLSGCTIHIHRLDSLRVTRAEVAAPGPVNVQNAAMFAPAHQVDVHRVERFAGVAVVDSGL